MKRKGITLLLIFCFLLINIMQVQSDVAKAKNTSSDEGYYFSKAYVWGKYEIMDKWFAYFHIYNSDINNNTINVWGYKNWEHRWYRVMANDVEGGLRVGFIGRHQCFIFAFGYLGLTVQGVNASSSRWM